MNKKVRTIAVSIFMILSFVVVVIHTSPIVEAQTTIYVPTDYPTIQEAIDAAQTGDTVYVYSGTYYENIVVDKTISLVGQNKDTTIIDNVDEWDFTIWTEASWVNITGFTVNGGPMIFAIGIGITSYNSVSGNNVLNSYVGIGVGGSNNKVENNYIKSNGHGINLVASSNNTIRGNEVTSNDGIGIWFDLPCNGNNIINNVISSNNEEGILLDGSHNNIINNIICNNNQGIINIGHPAYNNIIGNNISMNNGEGIWFQGSTGNNISNNIVLGNNFGIDLEFSNDNVVMENIIHNNNHSIGVSFKSSNNKIYGNNISLSNLSGIHFFQADNNNVTDNYIFSCGSYGINLDDSSGNNITGNTVISNKYGLHLESDSNGNTINNNDILENEIGIYLYRSSSNSITDNIMKDDGIFIFGNQLEHWNTHYIDTSNILNGKPVYYLKNQDGGIIPAGAGQVILANCMNINIENQEIGKTYVGVELGFSSNNNITNTNISESDYGVYFYSSSRNTIRKTNIFSNSNNVAQFSSSINNAFINCSLWNSSSYDFYLDGNSHAELLNTTFTRTSTFYDDSLSTLTVKWYLDVSVIDDMGNPVPNAKVKVEDNLNGSYNETFSTGGDGFVRWIPVTEYVENYYGKTYYTPHRIIAWNDTKVGYAYPEPFIDQSKTITIVLHNGTLLNLEPGWNLVSLPRPQLTLNIQTILQSIEGRYDAVQWYNVIDSNDPWKHYHILKPSGMNDLDELNHTMGFWLHVTDPEGTSLVIFGDELTLSQNISLYPGWNLVGYPSTSNKTWDVALGTLNFGSDVDSIWTYNATIQKWVELDEPTDYFEIGQGYWVHSRVEVVWNVPL